MDKNPVGRPTKYDPDFHPKKVVGYCLLGKIDSEIADLFEIAESTLNEWKKKYPEFKESIKSGKEEADVKIAASLFKRAMGSKEKVQKWFKIKETTNGIGSKETLEMREEEVMIPADTGAAIFWLKNRNPAMWRDARQVEVTDGTITGVQLVDDDEDDEEV